MSSQWRQQYVRCPLESHAGLQARRTPWVTLVELQLSAAAHLVRDVCRLRHVKGRDSYRGQGYLHDCAEVAGCSLAEGDNRVRVSRQSDRRADIPETAEKVPRQVPARSQGAPMDLWRCQRALWKAPEVSESILCLPPRFLWLESTSFANAVDLST